MKHQKQTKVDITEISVVNIFIYFFVLCTKGTPLHDFVSSSVPESV